MPVADSRPFPDTCPGIDPDDNEQAQALYRQYLASIGGHLSPILRVGLAELGRRINLSTIFQDVVANPAAYVDGQWGLSHGALTFLAIQGSANPPMEAGRQLAHWYAREAMARCREGIADWVNPFAWLDAGDADSFLDYAVPVLVVDYLGYL